MIRQLGEKDREMVMNFLSEEPSINLFMIGDIENYGFDDPIQTIWGDFDPDLKGVLLRYRDNFIPYYKEDAFDIEPFSQLIKAHDNQTMISGKKSIADKFDQVIELKAKKETFFCELREKSDQLIVKHTIKIADVTDADRLFNFLNDIDEFSGFGNSAESIKKKIESKAGRVYYLEDDKGDLITVSQTSAENSKSAMIVGVATRKDMRKKGYMSSCLSQLCLDLLEEGKSLCLFYDNPKAGSVYHRIGFKSIDKWLMMTEKGK